MEIADAEGRYDLWLIDVLRGVPSRLTTDPADEREPVWSPDGQELLFTSGATDDEDIVRQRLQGSDAGRTAVGQDRPDARGS